MADFVSVLGCLRTDTEGAVQENGGTGGEDEDEELGEVERKEVEDIVEDFMSMQNKEILRRDLKRMSAENVMLRRKVARLEERIKVGPRTELAFQIDAEGEDEAPAASTAIYDSVGLGDTSVLGSVPPPEPEPTPEKATRSSCFNCLGSHNLADCPEPRDQRRISQNRKQFQSSAAYSGARFFVSGRREKLAPGLPSAALREALGLREDQVPEYIYRLRDLGYPPGWMRQAEIHESGLGIYLEGERRAEGEGEEGGSRASVRYDASKLHSWPGFNSELPREFRDEGHKYRAKPQSRCESLTEMRRGMQQKAQKGYRKGKIQDASAEGPVDGKTVYDMEVEEGECNNTIDLTEDSSSQGEPGPPGDQQVEVKEAESTAPIVQPTGTGTIATTDTGTPIVEMFSPFESIPDNNKWGVNMSEHVAFENLPNYTGTWDKMTGLIKRIRDRKPEEDKD